MTKTLKTLNEGFDKRYLIERSQSTFLLTPVLKKQIIDIIKDNFSRIPNTDTKLYHDNEQYYHFSSNLSPENVRRFSTIVGDKLRIVYTFMIFYDLDQDNLPSSELHEAEEQTKEELMDLFKLRHIDCDSIIFNIQYGLLLYMSLVKYVNSDFNYTEIVDIFKSIISDVCKEFNFEFIRDEYTQSKRRYSLLFYGPVISDTQLYRFIHQKLTNEFNKIGINPSIHIRVSSEETQKDNYQSYIVDIYEIHSYGVEKSFSVVDPYVPH